MSPETELGDKTRVLPMRTGKASNWLITVLVIVATVLCYRLFNQTYNRELRKAVLVQLRQLFPEAHVSLGSVTHESGQFIVANNVRLTPKGPRRQKLSLSVFKAQRIELRGQLELGDWLHDSLGVDRVDIHGGEIRLWIDAEGRWSVQSIVPRPKRKRIPPQVHFHDLSVIVQSASDATAPSLSFHHISGTVTPQSVANSLEVGSQAAANSLLEASPSLSTTDGSRHKVHRLRAEFSGSSSGAVDRFECSVNIIPARRSYEVTGKLVGLQFSAGVLHRLPPQLSRYASQLRGLECEALADFQITGGPSTPVQFQVEGQIKSGRLRDARLPYPLHNLRGDFVCRNSRIELRKMKAESGDGACIALNADLSGLALDSPMMIVARAEHVSLDQRLYRSLPEKLQEQWDKLQLAGQVSAAMRLSFDGARWQPDLEVFCEEVSLVPWLFPYPLVGVRGLVKFHDNTISSSNLNGRCGGQEVSGNFSLRQVSGEWVGNLHCQVHGAIAIDETLIAAMTPRDRTTTGSERFIRSLHPSGSITLNRASFLRQGREDSWHRMIDASIYNGSIRYDGFRYPIDNISGRLHGQDDHWWLDKFEGRNDSGRIKCSGSWLSGTPGSTPFELRFEAFSLPMEEELKLALPGEVQFVWDELRPAGSVDRVSVNIHRQDPTAPVETLVNVSEDSSTNATSNRSLRVRPKTFPYTLTDVDCEIEYSPGHVTIHKASGINGSSRLSLKGICRPTPAGRWQANVEWLPQTRLIVDSELLKALPQSIRDSLVRVDFHGPISVLGRSEILFANRVEDRPITRWDCQVAVEDGQLADGQDIGSLRGTVWLQGYSDSKQLNASGQIALDALTVRDIPITRLTGPFALVDSKLYFGSSVADALPRVEAQRSLDMTANALSGKLMLSGFCMLRDNRFDLYLDASLSAARLSLLLQDLGIDSEDTEAVCDAQVSFDGNPWNPQTYSGRGKIQLRDAQLYQLPFMIRLMRVASVNAKDDSAFQTADISFEIDGDQIPLQVACDGEVLRLRGDGQTNLRRELELDLYSYVGRRNPLTSTLRPLLTDSRYATFMLIQVTGSLDNPIMQPKPFPQLEATIEQMFPDLAERRKTNPLLPWRR